MIGTRSSATTTASRAIPSPSSTACTANSRTIPASALSTPDHKRGLKAEYLNQSKFEKAQPLFTRTDRQINFHWWDSAPGENMNHDDFGIRWTGFLTAPTTGTYQIGAIGMNAFELYIDNKQITHFSSAHHGVYSYAPVMLEAGKRYPIRLDYHEFVNDAAIRFVSSGPDQTRPAPKKPSPTFSSAITIRSPAIP